MKPMCLHASPFTSFFILGEAEDEGSPISEVEDNVFEIPPSLLPELQKKIDTMNKKAAKIGVSPISVENLGPTFKEVYQHTPEDMFRIKMGDRPLHNPHKVEIQLAKVKVIGQRPQVAGYDFLATVEGKEAGNVLRVAPGAEKYEKEIQKYYNSDPGMCEWCKKRRRRTETFIVRDINTGELKQVGRNCLKDFLGGKSPQVIAATFAAFDDLYSYLTRASKDGGDGGLGGGMGRTDKVVDPKTALLMGVVASRLYGYKPSSFEGQTTAGMTRMYVFGPPDQYLQGSYGGKQLNPEYQKYEEMKQAISDKDKQQVEQILAWFDSLPDEKKKEPYFHNVNVLLKEPRVLSKDIGYIVGLIPTFARVQGQQLYQRGQPAAAKSNEWIGAVGQKIPPTKITVIRTRLMDSNFYGAAPTQIVNMEDEKGNVLTWFNNSKVKLQDGKSYTITGTVKKQDEYNGRKQTVITRAVAQPA